MLFKRQPLYHSEEEITTTNDSSSLEKADNTNIIQKNQKSKSQKMFRCTLCLKEYSNIGGIVTHQKNKHGEYNPLFLEKTENNKSKEHLGRPMQHKVRKIEQSQTVKDYLEKAPGSYTDKQVQFFLDRNLKYVFNAIMEAGDPILYRSKKNLFIKDFKDFESDPWANMDKQSELNLHQYFSMYDHNQIDLIDNMDDIEIWTHRIIEFTQKILESISDDQQDFIIFVFQQIYLNIHKQYKIVSDNVKQQLEQQKDRFQILNVMKQEDINQMINIVCYGTLCYVKNMPNCLYNTYFGYK